MKLIYHPRSPYSRKVFIVALETGLADSISLETVVVAPVHFPGWSDNVKDVAKFNPLAKIPTLVLDDGTGLFDSRIICEYLIAHRKIPAKASVDESTKWRLKTLQAASDGIMDAFVLVAYENRIRDPKGLKMQTWEDGQFEKIWRAVDFLEHAAANNVLDVKGADVVAEAAVVVAVGMIDSVGLKWRDGRPALAAFYDEHSKMESFTTTLIEKDWKTGEPVKLSTIEERKAAAQAASSK